jgi:ABC-type uncharacterized transport system substrate-binding protein
MLDVRRRQFITLLGGAAASWPTAARAQQKAMPVVGYLSSLGQAVSVQFDAAFRRGLSQMGYIEGQNVWIEYRWISDSYDQLPAMAADLVQRQVALICALGPPAVLAAKAATTNIPIVFVTGADPTEQLAALTVRHAVPSVHLFRKFAAAGGLMSYGSDEAEYYRLVGIYVGRILKGETPSGLPVQQVTKVELIINLKTARALGLSIPLPLSGRADELIE